MRKWKFVFVEEDTLHRLQKTCNEWGEQGWELVNFSQKLRDSAVSGDLRISGWTAMLKRRMP